MHLPWIIKLFLATVLPLLSLHSTELGYPVKNEETQMDNRQGGRVPKL